MSSSLDVSMTENLGSSVKIPRVIELPEFIPGGRL
jgi:hypothetical protein